ncbi:hypothetical protein UCREL1_10950 [Eutypa lata UCREL1]|uniref:BTB domain-containing protein n=1 Tax=Eutypa lata (strain UCR-EL1) TaxID=1287681 RepID=M7S7Q3_EUTLA|nr:hypothetical protein UCREL1_10950 [Eutypa lata UCREL1]
MASSSTTTANGGEGSSTSLASSTTATTLDDVMRAPAATAPDVVVLDTTHEEKERKRSLDPKEDLWLTSADGILLKAEYFRRALCGEFRESEAQAIDLPEEDPAIFHFIVAFLYEDKYVPILPVATVLAEDDKGKGIQGGDDESAASESDSSAAAVLSDSSNAASRRRRDRRRRQQDRHWERQREKHPVRGPSASTTTAASVPGPRRNGDRISGQDLQTWLLAYEHSIDVYICANKFLLDGFKQAIARVCIDMLETAGADAAQVEVLRLCDRLYGGVPESDRLLRMVFARVGFLQPHLFRRAPRRTLDFLHGHPEVSALLLREMGARREEDIGNSGLPVGHPSYNYNYPFPPMERPQPPPGPPPPPGPFDGPGRPMPRAHRW